jgi:putative two-component system response regulator
MMKETKFKAARILIIDDEKRNAEVLERLLKSVGFDNVQHLSDGREACDVYQSFLPDLILLDLKMPKCDGFEVMARLKDLTRGDYLPILILTAQRDQETRLRALEYGARDFLNKPFDFSEGLIRIRNVLEVRLLQNQIRMQNQSLEEKVQERSMELEDTRTEIIQRLGRAAEYRDNETGMHVIRMGHLSCRLGKFLGLSEEDQHCLLHAAPMHDIGKVGIPDRILLKAEKLLPEEWEIMKTHAQIGAHILSGGTSEIMRWAESIALSHHERWDATGYPNGLKHEDIPLCGRIVALCDVFDVLTTQRPYKPAWPVAVAMREIRSKSGRHFDPALVDLFEKNLSEMVEITDNFPDSSESESPLMLFNQKIALDEQAVIN